MSSTGPRRRAALGAFIVGSASAFAGDLLLFMFDDTCPQWEDEGSMAAPDSPYSLVMCGPGTEPPNVWSCYAGTVLALIAVLPLLRRRVAPRWGRTLIVAALVVPTLVITLLHLSLPRDCLTGRTDAGECGRDRELR